MGKEHECPYIGCKRKFSRPSKLTEHYRLHTGEKTFFCMHDGCDKAYARNEHLKRHERNCHGSQEEKKKSFTIRKCQTCEKEFKDTAHLRRHFKTHERKYKCQVCTKSFQNKQELTVHEYWHTGVMPYICPHEGCKSRFLRPSKLKLHLLTHANFHCDAPECSAILSSSAEFLRHKKNEHPVAYVCDKCGKSFNSRSNHDSHASTHLNERDTFECPYEDCKRFYYYEKNLKQHLLRVHEERYFTCAHDGCERSFKHKKSLANHMKIHEADYIPPTRRKNTNKPPTTLSLEDKIKKLVRCKPDMISKLSGMLGEVAKYIAEEYNKSEDDTSVSISRNGSEQENEQAMKKPNMSLHHDSETENIKCESSPEDQS